MEPNNKRLKIGEGKISGYVSIFLAILSFLAVFCFKFPEILTTPEFREVYKGEQMEVLLSSVIISSFFFAVLSFILSKRKVYALIGILISTTTILLGGFTVEASQVGHSKWHLGLDWLLLDLLLMAVIFIPIEMVWPKNKDQSRFHEEWRTDLVYFVISHLLIQFFGVVINTPVIAVFGVMGLSGIHSWIQQLPFGIELLIAFFCYRFVSILGTPFLSFSCLPVALSFYSSFNQKYGLACRQPNSLC